MPLISKHKEVQLHLSTMYDSLHNNVEKMKKELKAHRSDYENACHMHIKSGFQLEKLWLKADRNYQNKFKEFETNCFLLEILTEYRDEEGNFMHLEEFIITLESLLKLFIDQEAYETCAVIKKWQDHIKEKYI